MFASVVAARVLGKHGFGELGIIQSTVNMLGVFAGFGFGLTATKYVAEFRESDPDRAGKAIGFTLISSVVLGGVSSAGLMLFAPVLAERTLGAPHLAGQLCLGAILLLLNAVNGAQTGALNGFEAFNLITRVNIIRGVLQGPVMIAGVALGHLNGSICALIVTCFISLATTQIYLRRTMSLQGVQMRCSWGHFELQMLTRFAFPAFLASVVMGPATWLVNTLLVNQPNGFAEMGVFNAANQWRSAVSFFPSIIAQAALPIFCSLQGGGKSQSMKKALMTAMVVSGLSSLPFLAAIVLFSERIMKWYGAGFSGQGTVLTLTAVTAVLLSIMTPVGNVISAAGRMWLATAMNAGLGATLLFASWWFLRHGMGAKGIAAAYVVAYLVHATWTLGFAYLIVHEQRKA